MEKQKDATKNDEILENAIDELFIGDLKEEDALEDSYDIVNKSIDTLIDKVSEVNPIENSENNNVPENKDIDLSDTSQDIETNDTPSMEEENVLEDKTIQDEIPVEPYIPFEDLKEESLVKETNYITDNKGFYLGYNERLLTKVVATIIFFILALVLFVASISIKTKNNVVYRQNSNLDYKVYLKPNNYYKTPYLEKNMKYIAALIDNINVTFNYNFSSNQPLDYKYTYYVKADVIVSDGESKAMNIYSRTENLVNPVTITNSNSSNFNINQDVKVNYETYNNLVKQFKSSYSISAQSNLILTLVVDIEDFKGNKINAKDSGEIMKITVPLTEQMVDVKMESKEINNSNSVEVYKDFSISNKVTLILSIISIIVSLIFVIRLILFISKTSGKKSLYDVKLAKILREYDRVIVNSKKIVELSKDVIDVNSFEELLDVRDNLEKPIIFKEIHRGLKSVFIVKTDSETYRYVLKLADLEKEEKK